MTKISKNVARKLFAQGHRIYLMPSKARLGSIWILPMPITGDASRNFDQEVNAYHYYNCTKETGLRVHFYIED